MGEAEITATGKSGNGFPQGCRSVISVPGRFLSPRISIWTMGGKHPVEDVVQRINDLTDYYIDLNEEKGSRFNFDTTLWFRRVQEGPPGKTGSAGSASFLKNGTFEMGAFYAVLFNGILTEEEFIQCMMPARRIEEEFGAAFSSAVPTEVPSMNWGMATILAGAGIGHITRGAYEPEQPQHTQQGAVPALLLGGPRRLQGTGQVRPSGVDPDLRRLWRGKEAHVGEAMTDRLKIHRERNRTLSVL